MKKGGLSCLGLTVASYDTFAKQAVPKPNHKSHEIIKIAGCIGATTTERITINDIAI